MSGGHHHSHHGRTGDSVSIYSNHSRKSNRIRSPSNATYTNDNRYTGRSRNENNTHQNHMSRAIESEDRHIHHSGHHYSGNDHQLQLSRHSHRKHDNSSEHHHHHHHHHGHAHGSNSREHEMTVFVHCSCGANLYSKMLGPTADETLLVGLQTLMKMFFEKSSDARYRDDRHSGYALKRQHGPSHHDRRHSKHGSHYSTHRSQHSHHTISNDHKSHHNEHKYSHSSY